MLQWGHALMAWKTRHNRDGGGNGSDASMGPRFNGVEDDQMPFRQVDVAELQWGHALMAWKTALPGRAGDAQ